MQQLRNLGELDARVGEWKKELANTPDSVRLNLLLALSSSYVKGTSSEYTSAPNVYPPWRLQLPKAGSNLTGSFRQSDGTWRELRGEVIELPEKFLIGFCANKTDLKFSDVSLVVDGDPVPLTPTNTVYLSGPKPTGTMEYASGSGEIHGEGAHLQAAENDQIFFAYQEISGNSVTFEATVNAAPPGDHDTPGLMIRSSLDPGAVFSAVTVGQESASTYMRTTPSEAANYFATLLRLKSDDTKFSMAILDEMISRRFYAASLAGARAVLARDPLLIQGVHARFRGDLLDERR